MHIGKKNLAQKILQMHRLELDQIWLLNLWEIVQLVNNFFAPGSSLSFELDTRSAVSYEPGRTGAGGKTAAGTVALSFIAGTVGAEEANQILINTIFANTTNF